jgi:hypothetical protein
MTRATLRITMHALPLRPHRLTGEEIGKVFGGCVGLGELCFMSWECCPIEQSGQTVQLWCRHDPHPIYPADRCLP